MTASMPLPSMRLPSMPLAPMPLAPIPLAPIPLAPMPVASMPLPSMPPSARRCVVLAIACLLGAVLAAPTVARADDGATVDGESGANGANGASAGGHVPAVADVIAAAYAASGLDRDPARSWIRRARLAGLVPWVTVQVGRDVRWDDGVSAAAASNITNVGHYDTVEVRATWRLDRLLFDGRELQVASIEAARRRERRRLARLAIRAYFTWRRAVSGTAGDPAFDGDDAAAVGVRSSAQLRAARADEATAELDALTDGWFSRQLSGTRRNASETRTDGGNP